MKKTLLSIILLCSLIAIFVTDSQSINLPTIVSSPSGNYRHTFLDYFRFIPLSSPPELDGSCTPGGIYMNATYDLSTCLSTGNWSNGFGSEWKFDPPTNTITPKGWPGDNDIKIGIYTDDAEFMMDVDGSNPSSHNDGFLATGNYATGTLFDDRSLNTTTGATKLIWYPRKSVLRIGKMSSDEWVNANLGNHSASFGENNKNSSHNTFSVGKDNIVGENIANPNVTKSQYSTAFGLNNIVEAYNSFVAGENNIIEKGATNDVNWSYVGGLNMYVGNHSLGLDTNTADPDKIFVWGHSNSAVNIDDLNSFFIYSGRVRINSGRNPYPNPINGPTYFANLEIASDTDNLETATANDGDNSADIMFQGSSSGTNLGRIGFFKNNSCTGACPNSVVRILASDNTLSSNISFVVNGDIGGGNRFIFSQDANNNGIITSRTRNSSAVTEYQVTSPNSIKMISGYVKITFGGLFGAPSACTVYKSSDLTPYPAGTFSCTTPGNDNRVKVNLLTADVQFPAGETPILIATPNKETDTSITIRALSNTSFTLQFFDKSNASPYFPATHFSFHATGLRN